MSSRILLNLLLLPKFRLTSARLRSAAAQEQGFSLAVVLIAMLSVTVAGVAMANRTQTAQLATTLSGSNREAREAADAVITHILSEWNRKENRGVLSALQPMTAWQTTNAVLKNPCNTTLTPTASATSDLAESDTDPIEIDANRSFRLTQVVFRDGPNQFVAQPGDSTKAPTPPFTPNEIDIVVEGIFQRGNNTNKAQATKRLTLAPLQCGTPQGDGFFAFGGVNPNDTTTLANPPQTLYNPGDNAIASKEAENIVCLPIAGGELISKCPPVISGINVIKSDLSEADRKAFNPPTFASIPGAAGIKSISIAKTTTINGSGSNCVIHKGASHCSISTIKLAGGRQLTVDTTNRPVYLYVSGDITISGGADIVHTNSSQKVNSTNFPNYDNYQETTFRFQIRGLPAGSGSGQDFKFNGNPSGNLFIWAPTANLNLIGKSAFTSALFVDKLTSNGSTQITLVGLPQSFTDSIGVKLGSGTSLAARSTVFTKFF